MIGVADLSAILSPTWQCIPEEISNIYFKKKHSGDMSPSSHEIMKLY
jgi:hypothetical protein